MPKVTKLKSSIRGIQVFVDEEFAGTVSEQMLLDLGLYIGAEAIVKDIKAAAANNKLERAILNYMSLRPRSRQEVTNYLKQRRGLTAEEINPWLVKLEKLGYVNDSEFARWFVEMRLNSSKVYGPLKIRAELQAKGIAAETINTALKPLLDRNVAEVELEPKLEKLLTNLVKRFAQLDKHELRVKIIQRLLSRGIGYREATTITQSFLNR